MAGSHTSFDARFPSDYDLETARRFADELKLEDTRFSSHVYMHRLRVGGSSLVDHTHCEPALSANADPIELKLYPGFNCGIEDVCTAVSRTACAADRPVVFDYFGLVCVVDPGDSIATVQSRLLDTLQLSFDQAGHVTATFPDYVNPSHVARVHSYLYRYLLSEEQSLGSQFENATPEPVAVQSLSSNWRGRTCTSDCGAAKLESNRAGHYCESLQQLYGEDLAGTIFPVGSLGGGQETLRPVVDLVASATAFDEIELRLNLDHFMHQLDLRTRGVLESGDAHYAENLRGALEQCLAQFESKGVVSSDSDSDPIAAQKHGKLLAMSKVLGEIAQRAELLDIRRLVQEPDVRGILSELWSQTKAVLSGETQRGSQGASNGREQDLVQAGLLGCSKCDGAYRTSLGYRAAPEILAALNLQPLSRDDVRSVLSRRLFAWIDNEKHDQALDDLLVLQNYAHTCYPFAQHADLPQPSSGMWPLTELAERKADVAEAVKLMRKYQFIDQAELDIFERVVFGLAFDSFRYAPYALRDSLARAVAGGLSGIDRDNSELLESNKTYEQVLSGLSDLIFVVSQYDGLALPERLRRELRVSGQMGLARDIASALRQFTVDYVAEPRSIPFAELREQCGTGWRSPQRRAVLAAWSLDLLQLRSIDRHEAFVPGRTTAVLRAYVEAHIGNYRSDIPSV